MKRFVILLAFLVLVGCGGGGGGGSDGGSSGGDTPAPTPTPTPTVEGSWGQTDWDDMNWA